MPTKAPVRATSNLDAEIGQRVRRARLAVNMTQTELGDLLGLSFQQVQKYENGTNRISASRLWYVSCAVEVPIQYFYADLDQTDVSDFDENAQIALRTLRVARLIDEINESELKTMIIGLIKVVVQNQKL